jgi:hypothetical protein
MPLNITSSGTFKAGLDALRESLQSEPIWALISVPDELGFWYFLEFGTAPHVIRPVSGKALKFPLEDIFHFAHQVSNPGIRPRLIYRGIRDEFLHEVLPSWIAEGFNRYGFNRKALTQGLFDAMNELNTMLADQLDTQAPGLRAVDPDQGKLHGSTAGNVWRSKAVITGSQLIEI